MEKAITKMLDIVGYSKGMTCAVDETHGIATDGNFIDAYLLAVVLKEFIENGDVRIVMSQSPKSKPIRVDFLKRLIKGVEGMDASQEPGNGKPL
jgi:hypothetical protein